MSRYPIAIFAAVSTVVLAQSASAADMPVKARPPVIAVFDWTGFYLGAYAGVGAQRSHGLDPTPTGANNGGEIEYTGTGFTGGGTIGYNWQFNRDFVVGLEGDIGYLGLSHKVQDYDLNDPLYNSKTSWIGTLRARLGYTTGPTLSYITGGAAWVGGEDDNAWGTLGGQLGPTFTSSKIKAGYTFGSGVETMLGGNWTAKAEVDFVDVGHGDTLRGTPFPLPIQTDKNRYEIMKFGVNYLFGAKQPVLKAHNWNGFYAGLIGGTAITESRGIDPTGATRGEIGNNGTGLTIGGLAGYNWQFAPNWVAGVEGDFSYFGINSTSQDYDEGAVAHLGVKTNWLATLRGRLGYSTGPALLYVTGGGAWVNVQNSWDGDGGAVAASVSSTKSLSGATVGAGIETELFANWTTRTEYLYVDAGKGNTIVQSGNSMQVDHKFHIFRFGLIYAFR